MKNIVLCLVLSMITLYAQVYKGQVTDTSSNPLIGATVSFLSNDSTILLTTMTDTLGYYELNVTHYPAIIRIQSLGYKTINISISKEPDYVFKTVLEKMLYLLNEIVVTPEMVKHYGSHTSYRISQKEIANYANFAQAMNIVPFMTVTSSGNISYKGNSNIVLLLNGVKTTWVEIQALDKNDVSKIDVYENPPAQYALVGASAVINIVTKRNIIGGNLSLNLRDALYPIYGNNSLVAFYNYGKSRFSLQVNNVMAHYNKVQTNEKLQYSFQNNEYNKKKIGNNSPKDRDNNSIVLGYMINHPNRYQFNANLSTNFYKKNEKKMQTISYTNTENLNGESNLYNKYSMYSLNLYFNKIWDKKQSLLIDATGTLYSTQFKSTYTEQNDLQEMLFNSYSNYTTQRKSLLSTIQYTALSFFGQWTLGIRETYQSAIQKEGNKEMPLNQQTLHGYAQLYGGKNKFYYQLILASKFLNVKKENNTIWSKWYPAPTAKFWFYPQKNVTLQLTYSYSADVPSVSLMSETEQWLDNFYVYKGNSNLTPSQNHHIDLTGNIITPHINFLFYCLYNYNPNSIVNTFKTTSQYILQTYNNLQSKQEIGGQVVLDYFPLKNKSLKIGAVGIYIHHHGKEKNGLTWNGYRYQLMGYASYTLPKWDFEIYYQYPGQTLNGQLITPRAEVVQVDIAYKPKPNMSIGLQWNQPFMKGFKEGEHTTKACIIQSTSYSNIRDYANMICLKFSYNFSFGKQNKYPKQQIKNEDNDSGLLTK